MPEKHNQTANFSNAASQDASRQFMRNQWLILFCALFVIFLFLGYQSINLYNQTTEQEHNRLKTQARVISSNIERQLEAANLALTSVTKDIDLLKQHESDLMANRRMSALSDAMPGVRTMLILDANGNVTASNRNVLLGKNFKTRDYFALPAKENNPDLMYVSPPFKTILGVYVINASKVLQTADGRFDGVVAASLDPDYFKVLLGSVLYASDMKSSINHGDGIRFMSMPDAPGDSGKNLLLPGTFTTRHRASGREESVFTGKTATYGAERIEVMRTVSSNALKLNKPLYVECSRGVSAVYQDWRYTTLMQVFIFTCISLIAIFGLLILQRRQKNLMVLAEQAQYFMNIRLKLLDISMTQDVEGFLRLALDELCTLSGSQLGFYHLVDPDQKTLALQAWSTLAKSSLSDSNGNGVRYPIEQLGVCADCVGQKQPMIYNDRQSYPDRKSLTEGDVPICRELVVPVLRSGMVVACMGIANKADAYDESDLKQTAYLADVIWEIVERKRIEERCSLMAMIVEQSPLSVVMTDTDANITYVNHYFEQLTGYSVEEAKGNNPRILKSGITSPETFVEMWDRLKSGCDWEGELCNRKKDGSYYWEKTHLFPVFNREGEVVQYAGIKEDITARKQFEEELKLAKSEAEAASRAKSEFLANMSHEIRTPMNAITGISYLALKTDLDPQQRDYLEKIRNAADSLLGIINDILDFSKIEAGRMELEQIEFSLLDVLENISEQIALKAEEKGNKVQFSIDSGVPSRLVGDALRLGQIISNLVSNAVKFTDQGNVVVSVEVAPLVKTGAVSLAFRISDTGIGMTPRQLERIFAPFEQADSSTTRKYGGTGLGLTIVMRLIELMGGSLQVTSEPGIGSSFSFTVSFGLANHDESDARTEMPEKDRFAGWNGSRDAFDCYGRPGMERLAGLRVLVVEDNSINRQIMLELLWQVGIAAECAFDGREAVEKVGSSSGFDAVLMDLQMPVMDGLEAARRIRELKNAEELPIIAITAHVMARDRERCLAAGMNGHVSKPIYPDELYGTLMQVVLNSREEGKQSRMPAQGAPETAVPDLPGIVVEHLLERINGNCNLLRSLVIEFRSQNLATVAHFRQALKNDDRKRLVEMAHALKGVSGNIGAESLSATAHEFESAVKGGNSDLFMELIDVMERQMGEVFESARILEEYDKVRTVTGGVESRGAVDQAALELAIRELYDLLIHNKVSAMGKFIHLKQICPEQQGCQELERLIAVFDYKGAQLVLQKLAEMLGVAVGVRQ